MSIHGVNNSLATTRNHWVREGLEAMHSCPPTSAPEVGLIPLGVQVAKKNAVLRHRVYSCRQLEIDNYHPVRKMILSGSPTSDLGDSRPEQAGAPLEQLLGEEGPLELARFGSESTQVLVRRHQVMV